MTRRWSGASGECGVNVSFGVSLWLVSLRPVGEESEFSAEEPDENGEQETFNMEIMNR